MTAGVQHPSRCSKKGVNRGLAACQSSMLNSPIRANTASSSRMEPCSPGRRAATETRRRVLLARNRKSPPGTPGRKSPVPGVGSHCPRLHALLPSITQRPASMRSRWPWRLNRTAPALPACIPQTCAIEPDTERTSATPTTSFPSSPFITAVSW